MTAPKGGQLLAFVGGIALYLLLGLLLWWGLNLYINPHDSAEKKDLVQALALIMAGVAGVIGILFTWRGQGITQLAQQENLDITRRGQITERFTQAIDQLGKTDNHGKKSLEIRLGAIYSLARTARDSESDHWPVMEVLTAYVRLHAPRKREGKEREEVHFPDLEIQAILTVLRQRSKHHRHVEYGPIDLHDTDLQLANLQGADLQQANLRGATLQNANLQSANMRGADLLTSRGLNKEQLEQAFRDEDTLLPESLQ